MEAFTGEIRMFAFGYAPENWAKCDGSALPVPQHMQLASILGQRFGDKGETMVVLPDLRGRAGLGVEMPEPAPNLWTAPTPHLKKLGEYAGAEKTSVSIQNLPPHGHDLYAIVVGATPQTQMNRAPSTARMVSRLIPATGSAAVVASYASGQKDLLAPEAIATAGEKASVEIDIMQPYLALTTCICLNGDMPERY